MFSLRNLVVIVCLALAGCATQSSVPNASPDALLVGNGVTVRNQAMQSREMAPNAVEEEQLQRPARPARAPNGAPGVWAADVRVNTLVSNHGVGTAGEPGIAILPDRSGGSFLFWEDAGLGVVRTQHVDAGGTVLWDGGVVSTSPAYQASPSAVSNGDGTMLVAWVDGRNGGCDSTSQMYCEIYIQRLDAFGSRSWGDGLPVTNSARYPAANRFAMVSDGAGGAYLAWTSGTDFYNCCSYYMQHIGADGSPLWAVNGLRMTELPTLVSGPGVTGPRLVTDDSGGVILAWWNQQAVDGSVHLFAQRFGPTGTALWDPAGVEVTFTGTGHANFDAVSDGAGGVIFAVQSKDVPKSANTHVYVQRVSASGAIMWPAGGVQLSLQAGAQMSPTAVSDGTGGAFVAWSLFDLSSTKNSRVSVMHVDGAGNLLWPAETTVTESVTGQAYPHVFADASGGVIVGWQDCRTVTAGACSTGYDLYTQRIGPTGKREWGADGFPVSASKANQGVDYGDEKRPGFEMVADGNGGVTFVWPDGRLKMCSASLAGWCDLYARHLAP